MSMRKRMELEEKIRKLQKSLDIYKGGDEFTSERNGWLDALLWVLQLKEESTFYGEDGKV